MLTLAEQLAKEKESLVQLQRRQMAKEQREQKQKSKLDSRRRFIIGELIEKKFPELLNYQPRRTQAENKVEFAPLELFLDLLAADDEYLARLKAKTNIV